MKNRSLGLMFGVLIALTFVLASCATLGILTPQQAIKHNADGIAQLVRVTMLPDGSESKSSCTAFHIGDQQLLTAAHCFEELFLMLYEDPEKAPFLHRIFQHSIQDSHGHIFKDVRVLKFNPQHDLVLLKVKGFHGGVLKIWNPFFDGEPEIGSEIMSLGFPGYYARNFTFEYGILKDIRSLETGLDVTGPYIISRGTLYPGYSGGPTISVGNGKVIGLNHASGVIPVFGGRDRINLSLAIPYDTINKFLLDIGNGAILAGTVSP